MQLLSSFAKDFMNQNVENVQQMLNLLSNRVGQGDKCSVRDKKTATMTPEMTKNLFFFQPVLIF